MMAKRMVAFLVAMALILWPMPLTATPPSLAPLTEPASSPALITLTEEELTEILAGAIDEAVAPHLEAQERTEKALRDALADLKSEREAARVWQIVGISGVGLGAVLAILAQLGR